MNDSVSDLSTAFPPETPSLFRRLLIRTAEVFACLLTLLLPAKFGGLVSVPEMQSAYWGSLLEITLCQWPLYVGDLLCALLLALTLAAVDGTVFFRRRDMLIWSLIWGALALLSLPGVIRASAWDYAAQMVNYVFGVVCFALSIHLLLVHRRGFAIVLLYAVSGGFLLSLLSGLYQYFQGFENTIQYLYAESVRTGRPVAENNTLLRLREARVSADFAVCNVFAGYLVTLLFPVAYLAWRTGERYVQPGRISRWIFSVPVTVAALFLLWKTGSRGGILALAGGVFLTAFCLRLTPRWRMALILCALGGGAVFAWMVYAGRGFGSMIFRFEYFQAAFRMMFHEPWCGTGWGDFFHTYPLYKNLVNTEAPHTPHNLILLFGSQAGIPAFIAACVMLIWPLFCGLKRLRHSAGPLRGQLTLLLLTAGFMIWSLDSLLEVNFETPASLLTAVVLGYLVLLNSSDDAPSAAVRPARTGYLFSLCAAVWMLFSFTHSLQMIRAEWFQSALFDAATESGPAVTPDVADSLFRNSVQAAPRSPFPYANYADYLLNHGLTGPDYVEELLDQAIQRAPLRAGFYFRKYKLLRDLPGNNSAARARDALDRARSLFPSNPDYAEENLYK